MWQRSVLVQLRNAGKRCWVSLARNCGRTARARGRSSRNFTTVWDGRGSSGSILAWVSIIFNFFPLPVKINTINFYLLFHNIYNSLQIMMNLFYYTNLSESINIWRCSRGNRMIRLGYDSSWLDINVIRIRPSWWSFRKKFRAGTRVLPAIKLLRPRLNILLEKNSEAFGTIRCASIIVRWLISGTINISAMTEPIPSLYSSLISIVLVSD